MLPQVVRRTEAAEGAPLPQPCSIRIAPGVAESRLRRRGRKHGEGRIGEHTARPLAQTGLAGL